MVSESVVSKEFFCSWERVRRLVCGWFCRVQPELSYRTWTIVLSAQVEYFTLKLEQENVVARSATATGPQTL